MTLVAICALLREAKERLLRARPPDSAVESQTTKHNSTKVSLEDERGESSESWIESGSDDGLNGENGGDDDSSDGDDSDDSEGSEAGEGEPDQNDSVDVGSRRIDLSVLD